MSMMKISFQGFWVSQNEILNSRYLEVNEDNNGLRWRKIGLTIRYLGLDQLCFHDHFEEVALQFH